MSTEFESQYYCDLVSAFVRGKLPDAPDLAPGALFDYGERAGLRLHKFKRSSVLPRVRRVFGFFHQLQPLTLLDVGSGRGAFLWPLLDTFPELTVHCIDVREDRVLDINAVHTGGIERVSASVEDATQMSFADNSFDGVTMLEVLEHMPEPGRAIAEAVRVARTFVAVSVPSKPDDNPEHIHLFNEESLTELFRAVGVEKLSIDYVLNHLIALAVLDRK